MDNPLVVKKEGLYCPIGDFHIDAWLPVDKCFITHAHGDHAHSGHKLYICSENTAPILKLRLGPDIPIETRDWEKKYKMNQSWVSLHPAGHILGSSQVRIETSDGVCVVSGDYKRRSDPTCEPFSLQKCDIFVTESTFGLPIYMWEDPHETVQKVYDWWQLNRSKGDASILFCYALGKAQRVLSLLKDLTSESIYVHGAILNMADLYKAGGIALGNYSPIHMHPTQKFTGELILAPPMAKGSPWMKKFFPYKTALASGWMQVRGVRKRKNLDNGFALSDHADWKELLETVKETGASKILTTHGNASTLANYLSENGYAASVLSGAEAIEEGEGTL